MRTLVTNNKKRMADHLFRFKAIVNNNGWPPLATMVANINRRADRNNKNTFSLTLTGWLQSWPLDGVCCDETSSHSLHFLQFCFSLFSHALLRFIVAHRRRVYAPIVGGRSTSTRWKFSLFARPTSRQHWNRGSHRRVEPHVLTINCLRNNGCAAQNTGNMNERDACDLPRRRCAVSPDSTAKLVPFVCDTCARHNKNGNTLYPSVLSYVSCERYSPRPMSCELCPLPVPVPVHIVAHDSTV